MVSTIKVDAQSKQQELYVFIFCNPVAIQFLFVAILSDCSKICMIAEYCWKMEIKSVLNTKMLLDQDTCAIAMGFSGCNDMLSSKLLAYKSIKILVEYHGLQTIVWSGN